METVATPTVTIRPAVIGDLSACVEMILALRQATYWRHVDAPTHPELMTLYIAHRLATNPQCCLLVADVDGKLVGLCGGEIVSHWLAPHVPLLGEWAWWVTEAHRAGTVGARLWLSVVAWAKERGVRYGSRSKVLSAEKQGRAMGTESFTMKEL